MSALERVYASQHPSDCSSQKFIISSGFPGGFGAMLHIEGLGLAIAMQLGRLYLSHPDGDNLNWETKIPFCQERGEVAFNCFYEPWSNCSYPDALQGHGVNNIVRIPIERFHDIFGSEERRLSMIKDLEGTHVFILDCRLVLKPIFDNAIPYQVTLSNLVQ